MFPFSRKPPPAREPRCFLLHERLLLFFITHWRGFIALITPIILIIFLAVVDIDKELKYGFFCFFLMAVYWLTECIPLMITALVPLVVFPIGGIKTTREMAQQYFNHPTFLLCGALMIAYSCAQSGLSRRIATCGFSLFGNTNYRIFSSMILVTAFASHWIPNTAAVVVAIPLVFAILTEFEHLGMMSVRKGTQKKPIASRITSVYFSSLVIAAALGGMACLIGCAGNIAFKGLFDMYDELATIKKLMKNM